MMKSFFRVLGLATIVALTLPIAAKAEIYAPKSVIELFTSQGCSSCPPADEIMAGYEGNNDVLTLSWHVDYWNYLGWKDTFSKAEFTDRQKRYARTLQERQIYTPQAIVNGRDHTVGSRKGEIEDLMKGFIRQGKNLTVPIDVKITGGQMQIRVNDASVKNNKNDPTLYMVYFNRSSKVKIVRGENRGKTIVYRNIVRDTQMLGMLKSGVISVDLPISEVRRAGYDSCAILLQEMTDDGTPGAIIGATVVNDLGA